MKTTLFLSSLLLLFFQSYSQNFEVESPDGNLKIKVENVDKISCSVFLEEKAVIEKAEIGMGFSWLCGSEFSKISITLKENYVFEPCIWEMSD